MKRRGEAGCGGRAMAVEMRQDWRPWSSCSELSTRPVIRHSSPYYVSLLLSRSGNSLLPPNHRAPCVRPLHEISPSASL